MPVEPCPSCKQPVVILEDTATLRVSIGCRQVFLRRRPDDIECQKKPAMMDFYDTRPELIKRWNEFAAQKND